MKRKIVVTEPMHEDGLQLLEQRDDFEVVRLNGDASKLADALADADAALVRTMRVDAQAIKGASRLQLISRHGVGCDTIAVEQATRQGVRVAIAVDSNTTSVVEHALMMMLALNKQLIGYDRSMRNNRFADRGSLRTSELLDKHVLIVGFGRIGRRIAPVCRAFGMRVTVADIALDRPLASQLGCDAVEDFRPVLEHADYVTLHVPLDATTHHLIGAAELASMQQHAILINCARGGIVDEAALADAINSGSIAGFGSDVFSVEPTEADNPLLALPNCVLTPHNAAGTDESMRRMAVYAAGNLIDHFDGKLRDECVFNLDALNGA